MNGEPLILGIETSCDETAVAVVRGREPLSSLLASQSEDHAVYAGRLLEIREGLV